MQAPTRQKVLEANAKLKKTKLENLAPQLEKASGYAFYNTSLYDFDRLLGDAPNFAANLRNYIRGFSKNMAEVMENHIVRTVCDPCCGTGGMLTIAKERILELNPHAQVYLFGQEVSPRSQGGSLKAQEERPVWASITFPPRLYEALEHIAQQKKVSLGSA